MRIKEAVKQTGLTEKTIRYYESCGLVIPDMEMRFDRLWRDYKPEHIRLLSAVATLRRASFRVEEIARLLSAPEKIPVTVEDVYRRAEAARDEAEKLCARLGQEDLRESPDILTLARRLEETAAGYSLPLADRSFDLRKQERRVKEPRSLGGMLALKLGAVLLCAWLAAMAANISLLAGYIREQTVPLFAEKLEETLAGLTGTKLPDAFLLPEPEYTLDTELKLDYLWLGFSIQYIASEPSGSFPNVKKATVRPAGAWLTLNSDGQLLSVNGFEKNSAFYLRTGLTVHDGFLSMIAIDEGFSRYLNLQGYGTSTGAFPARGEANRILVDRGNQERAVRRETPPELLEGIESGEFSFDSAMLRKTTVLRGRWLRDAEGKPATFVLAAYAWNPFAAAVRALLPFGARLLVFFLLLGALLWLALRRSLLQPMKALNKALATSPVEVSAGEFDFALRYRELQSLTSGYLLRRQMLSAAPEAPPEADRADLNEAMEAARRKLLPLILDRNLNPVLELAKSGKAAADPEKLTDALLALIREVLPYGNGHARLLLRTGEKEGFLLAEAEVGTKWQLRSGAFASLWEGVYRLPGSGDAPGAKLRRASAALPGSFCAVRRTKKGLALTLGLPKAAD